MRPPRYQDTTEQKVPVLQNHNGAELRALAGTWQLENNSVTSSINDLAGNGAIADVILPENTEITLDTSTHNKAIVYIHSGSIMGTDYKETYQLEIDPTYPVTLKAGKQGLGVLILLGNSINETIAHRGPFVMNTQEELHQAIRDYQTG